MVAEVAMERVFNWLLAAGYPKNGVDWLRRLRLPVLIVLVALSWLLFVGLGWVIVVFIF